MKSIMRRMVAEARRVNKTAEAQTEKGLVTLWLVPVRRGLKVHLREDWYLNRKRIEKGELLA